MRFDVLDQLSDGQVVTTSTAVTTNAKRKKAITQDLGIGSCPQMGLCVFPRVSATGGATYVINAVDADVTALTTSKTVIGSRSFAAGELVAGKGFFIPVPGGKMAREFFGGEIIPTGGTTPSVTLDIYWGSADDVANYKSFQTSYNVAN